VIKDVDSALLDSLKKGLSGVTSSEIISGHPGKKKAVYMENTDFTVEETTIGNLSSELKEEYEETFSGDGKNTMFKLLKKPVNNLILVEYPRGKPRSYPDDFFMDYTNGTITFRDPPPKSKDGVYIKYDLPMPRGESSFLKFNLTYAVTIVDEDDDTRDKATMACIEALFKDMVTLRKLGIEDIRLIRGLSEQPDGQDQARQSTLIYNVKTTVRLETMMPSIERIQILETSSAKEKK
jgi:hypothetical protein